MLNSKAIKEFKHIFKEEFGKELSDQEAFEAANNLLSFFKTLIKIKIEARDRARLVNNSV